MIDLVFRQLKKYINKIQKLLKIIIYIVIFTTVLYLIFTLTIIHYNKERLGGYSNLTIYTKFKISNTIEKKLGLKNIFRINVYGNKYRPAEFNTVFKNKISFFDEELKKILLKTSSVYFLIPIIVCICHYFGKRAKTDKLIRGLSLIQAKYFNAYIASHKNKFEYQGKKYKISDNLYIPENVLLTHMMLIGRSGCGKSTMIYKLVKQLIERDKKIIIHDSKGDLISYFYDQNKHLIFNPLDVRHLGLNNPKSSIRGWTLFNDLKSHPVIDSFVNSILPENNDKNSSAIWHIAPRDILKSLIYWCIQTDNKKNSILCDLLLMNQEQMVCLLEEIAEGAVGLKHLNEPKLAGQYNSILSAFTNPLRYLAGTDGNFSIVDWVQDPNPQHKVIFFSNYAMIQDTLSIFISMFSDFVCKTLLSLPDSNNRRLFLILDELAEIPRLPSLPKFLSQSRSKGGSAVLGFQDPNQIINLYGKEKSNSIINGCSNCVCFGANDPETAKFSADKIGTVEIKRTEESSSINIDNNKDHISESERIIKNEIVLPNEIQVLPTRTFYFKMLDAPVVKDVVHKDLFHKKNEPFLIRNDMYVSKFTSDSNEKKSTGDAIKQTVNNLVNEVVSIDKNQLISDLKESTVNSEIPVKSELEKKDLFTKFINNKSQESYDDEENKILSECLKDLVNEKKPRKPRIKKTKPIATQEDFFKQSGVES